MRSHTGHGAPTASSGRRVAAAVGRPPRRGPSRAASRVAVAAARSAPAARSAAAARAAAGSRAAHLRRRGLASCVRAGRSADVRAAPLGGRGQRARPARPRRSSAAASDSPRPRRPAGRRRTRPAIAAASSGTVTPARTPISSRRRLAGLGGSAAADRARSPRPSRAASSSATAGFRCCAAVASCASATPAPSGRPAGRPATRSCSGVVAERPLERAPGAGGRQPVPRRGVGLLGVRLGRVGARRAAVGHRDRSASSAASPAGGRSDVSRRCSSASRSARCPRAAPARRSRRSQLRHA